MSDVATAKAVWIGINDVTISNDFQMRQRLSSSTVDEYAELIADADIPWPFDKPCKVYRVNDELILVDGFHRVAAVVQSGEDQIFALIINGSKTDALKAALSANITHGLRRSNDDKRRAVTIALADATLSKWSDRKLAELCGVSDMFVGKQRGELQTVCSSPPENRNGPDKIVNGVRIGADGKQRPSDKASQITQRQKIVAAVMATDGASNREIAKMVGCDHKTVASVRREIDKEHPEAGIAVFDDEPECDEYEEGVDLLDVFVAIKQEIRLLFAQVPLSDRESMWRQVVENLNGEDVATWKQ